ncbi:MAG TPA: [LysW]-aminoadipate kinase [Methanofastidiosum sp.]|jgi:acetylglutamate/LysW-gamma-L-alpha-aminoadipate kinase|nr:[LysW]-aminoadipate kinase [Methanofastidiosum sp.]HNZ87136.1 [LysW]-aminoadipate kinase [Methanofastidiosum sp.]HOC77272.1 [LysW]-aminoadipate kinase [Methanofastidiosum sp.]HOG73479.1 [LysW]-aminoadipate kinase [Methanofastidiosum sp.]HPA48742.1 [LysW]-aminoadipate kinase [Methanofastidiosum sp.]
MIVIKIGGSLGTEVESLAKEIAELAKKEKIIVVHGGSYETTEISKKLGKETKFVTSVSGFRSRYTDLETVQIMEMVMAGKINKELVKLLQKSGANAFGLSGADGKVLLAKRKDSIKIIEDGKKKILKDDYTGKVENVNKDLIDILLDNGYLPIICPLAISPEGDIVNTDGDRAAAAIASALSADLIVMTNVDGFLKDGKLVSGLNLLQIDEAYSFADGGMKKKLLAAKEAIEQGSPRVIIARGNLNNSLENALKGKRTVISK